MTRSTYTEVHAETKRELKKPSLRKLRGGSAFRAETRLEKRRGKREEG